MTSQVERPAGQITVGSWPGQSYEHNPFIKLFCTSLEGAGADVVDISDTTHRLPRMDVLHIHWPDTTLWWASSPRNAIKNCAMTLLQVARAKQGGTKVVWMVHDLAPLEVAQAASRTWKLYIAALSRMVDGFMTLSPETVAPVKAAYPVLARRPYAAPHHPRYDVALPDIAVGAAKATLGFDADTTVFTFFGLIRPTKGVISLAKAFRTLSGAHYRLVIAGQPTDPGYMAEIRSALGDDPRVVLRLGHVDDADAALVAAATDAFVLPFRSSLHSGTLIYSVSSGRPAITPDAPYARGLDQEVGPGWITRYQGELTADVLAAWRPPPAPPRLDAFSAAGLGEAAMALYARLMGRPA